MCPEGRCGKGAGGEFRAFSLLGGVTDEPPGEASFARKAGIGVNTFEPCRVGLDLHTQGSAADQCLSKAFHFFETKAGCCSTPDVSHASVKLAVSKRDVEHE